MAAGEKISRRKFLQSSVMAGTALMVSSSSFVKPAAMPIGLQLYSLRKIINPGNLKDVLSRISGIGYRSVELFVQDDQLHFWGHDAARLRELLKERQLNAPSVHINFQPFLVHKDETEFKRVCESINLLGAQYIVVPWIDEAFRKNISQYIDLADRLNDAGRIARSMGLQLSYHNHDFEFAKPYGDKCGYDILLSNTDPALVEMELDLYWCDVARVDPIGLFKKYLGRFTMWHVKDRHRVTKSFTEVGNGSINFTTAFKQAHIAGLEHFFVEQDEIEGEELASIQKSFKYVRKKLLPKLNSIGN